MSIRQIRYVKREDVKREKTGFHVSRLHVSSLRLALLLRIQVEIKIHQLFAAHESGRAVAEAEFFEELNGRLALHERVERDLEIALIVAEFQSRLNQPGADAPAAHVGAHA